MGRCRLVHGERGLSTLKTVTRAAFDFGYNCAVAHDACAAMDLAFDNTSVPARQVHASFMVALAVPYAQVITAREALGKIAYRQP